MTHVVSPLRKINCQRCGTPIETYSRQKKYCGERVLGIFSGCAGIVKKERKRERTRPKDGTVDISKSNAKKL